MPFMRIKLTLEERGASMAKWWVHADSCRGQEGRQGSQCPALPLLGWGLGGAGGCLWERRFVQSREMLLPS